MKPICPLTLTDRVELLDKIDVASLKQLYKNNLGIDLEGFYGLEYIFKYKSIDTSYEFFYPFNIEGNANLYHLLENFDWYYLEQKWEHDKAIELILKGTSWLEVGCGDGSFLERLTKNGIDNAIGLELNTRAIERSKKRFVTVLNETVESYKKKATKFDVVCSFQVLEHISNVRSFIESQLDLLKPGGKLIISVPNNDSFIKHDDENALNYPPHHMGRWNSASLTSIGEIFELTVDSIFFEPLQSYHVDWYVRILLKRILGQRLYYFILNRRSIHKFVRKQVCKRLQKIKGHSIMIVFIKNEDSSH